MAFPGSAFKMKNLWLEYAKLLVPGKSSDTAENLTQCHGLQSSDKDRSGWGGLLSRHYLESIIVHLGYQP